MTRKHFEALAKALRESRPGIRAVVTCVPCRENGRYRKATWSVPQSINQGDTIRYVEVCDSHQSAWWDGSDWDGSHLERRLSPGDDYMVPESES